MSSRYLPCVCTFEGLAKFREEKRRDSCESSNQMKQLAVIKSMLQINYRLKENSSFETVINTLDKVLQFNSMSHLRLWTVFALNPIKASDLEYRIARLSNHRTKWNRC